MRRAFAPFGPVLRNRDLLRVQVAFAGFQATEFAVWIAMLVYAFGRGGTTTAAIVAVIQLVPAALFAPIGGTFADRAPAEQSPRRGLRGSTVAIGATAIALFGGAPAPLIYLLAAVASTAMTITRPTQAVLTPSLARTADELTAVNVVTGWIETSASLAGPTIAGALLAIASPGAVFAVFGVIMAGATLLVGPLARRSRRVEAPADDRTTGSALGEVAEGFRALARDRNPRLLVILLACGYVVWGAFDVLAVVLSIDVLDLGNGGVGYLNAAFGAGAVAGAAGTVALVGRKRLVPPILVAAIMWGAAFGLLGISSATAAAVALLVIAGVGQALLDVAGRTLLQRISRPDVLARIFGIHEGLTMAALAIGAIMVPPLVAGGGAVLAFAVVGALLPVFVLGIPPAAARIDAAAHVPIVEISLLRSLRIFESLPPPALEGLAHNIVPVEAAAGEAVLREGETGDRYYAIVDGQVGVTRDGNRLATLGRGEGFGEIALLRDVPRTATVAALVDTKLYALEREAFLIALTGHAPAAEAADQVVRERSPGAAVS